jgi:hypothetical protein
MNVTQFMTTMHYGVPVSVGGPLPRPQVRKAAPAPGVRRQTVVRPLWRRGARPVVPAC